MLLVLAAIVAAIGFFKVRQIQTAIAQSTSFRPPPTAVSTIVAAKAEWETSLEAIGSVVAAQGVTVSADVSGIVERIAFDSGKAVRAGDLLVQLDAKQERAQLAAAAAQRDLARTSLERMRGLQGKGITSQAELDGAEATFASADALTEQFRAAIERKTIRAPFSGVLGIRQVNLGQYLASGDPVVPLQSVDPIHVDFALPQQELSRLAVGTPVTVAAETAGEVLAHGEVTAIDTVVDAATRNVRVRATLPNKENRLRPGMFVNVALDLGQAASVIALPATSVSYAPYGDSVYVVEEAKGPDGAGHLAVRQVFVKLGPARGDQVAVLSGLEPGETVVTSGVFKLRNGAEVVINNEIQPANDPTPLPEES
jgi:membrane fusion protein (multidrug efflux system)